MFWWPFLAVSSPALADIAPPRPAAPSCDLRRCPGQEARWCGQEEESDTCPPIEADGWTSTCERRSHTLYCRDFRTLSGPLATQPPPTLAGILTGESPDRACLKQPPRLLWPGESQPAPLAEGTDWTRPLPAWLEPDATVQVAVALAAPLEGLVLLDALPEALEPVLQEPLPLFDQPDGAPIGALQPGSSVPVPLLRSLDIPPPEDWSRIQLPSGLPLESAWTPLVEPKTGPIYAPAAPPEGEPLCLSGGSPLSATPGGPTLASIVEDCPAGWLKMAEAEGWVQAAHPSGLRLWTPTASARLGLSAGSLGLGGLGLGRIGVGGSSSPTPWHTVEAPVWLYEAPGGAIVGRLVRGRVAVESAQEDGWWSTRVESLAGERPVWIAPAALAEAAPATASPDAAAVAVAAPATPARGCQASGAWGGLWLSAGMLLSRRRRGSLGAGDQRAARSST